MSSQSMTDKDQMKNISKTIVLAALMAIPALVGCDVDENFEDLDAVEAIEAHEAPSDASAADIMVDGQSLAVVAQEYEIDLDGLDADARAEVAAALEEELSYNFNPPDTPIASYGCGSYYPANFCPLPNEYAGSAANCSQVPAGSYCEGDAVCPGTYNHLDNCGAYDWFFRYQ